jgi:hypothetical protein
LVIKIYVITFCVVSGGDTKTVPKKPVIRDAFLFSKTVNVHIRKHAISPGKENGAIFLSLFGTDSDQNRMLEEIPRSGSDSLPL